MTHVKKYFWFFLKTGGSGAWTRCFNPEVVISRGYWTPWLFEFSSNAVIIQSGQTVSCLRVVKMQRRRKVGGNCCLSFYHNVKTNHSGMPKKCKKNNRRRSKNGSMDGDYLGGAAWIHHQRGINSIRHHQGCNVEQGGKRVKIFMLLFHFFLLPLDNPIDACTWFPWEVCSCPHTCRDSLIPWFWLWSLTLGYQW